MIIRYSDGSFVEGSIHRLQGGTLRATVAGVDDTVEYTLLHGRWTSEMGAPVTFEFPLDRVLEYLPVPRAASDAGDSDCAAGGDCALRRIAGARPVN